MVVVALKSQHIGFNPKLYDIAVRNMNDTKKCLVNWHPSESVFITHISSHRIGSHGVNAFLIGVEVWEHPPKPMEALPEWKLVIDFEFVWMQRPVSYCTDDQAQTYLKCCSDQDSA